MTLAAPSPVRQRAGAGAEKPEGQKSKRQEARDKVGDKNTRPQSLVVGNCWR